MAVSLAGSLVSPSLVHAEERKQQCLAAYAEAQELRLKGALLAARARLLTCMQPGCPGPVVRDCAGWLSDVDASLSSIVFALSDEQGRDIPDGRVSVQQRVVTERTDGRAVLMDPGTYMFVFDAPGFVGEQRRLAVRQSEKNRIVRVQLKRSPTRVKAGAEAIRETNTEPRSVSQLAHPAAPVTAVSSQASHAGRAPLAASSSPSWPVVTTILGGVALAGVGGFAYFGLQGASKRERAEQCVASCRELIESGKRDYIVADISLGVAGASAVAAVLVYLLAESGQDSPRAPPDREAARDGPASANARAPRAF